MEHLVRVSGGELWAEDCGGDGPPLVLLHPGIGDSRIWDQLLSRLTARHRVIRYDVRGYGRSPQPTGPYSRLADLIAVLDHFGLRRVALVGCSMGGETALNLALAAPEKVASLVLLCPGITGYPWPPEEELDAEYEALSAAGDEAGLIAFGLREWSAAGADPTAVRQMTSAARAWPSEDQYQLADPDTFERLGELDLPAVLLVGDLDRPALIAANEQIADRIPGCRLVVVPGADHYLPLRAPELIIETILAGPAL
ncbi:alpha/beta fold hydrolase [Kitasatospora kifunensis]|uniref:Pimeloyl-ACP methyl ester carboxylesterase n=1 Tax=Kitasatospora kifunensis TaxID=58351 RepID=A0A7W7QZ65_KITKI|nr:alpha/beta hydrolase [Kitasatospora kifunensis]MBB4922517.1 pimeloyl-ACP methyl ester carboxylesterase [Kitasatospora kifunensis]